MQINCVYIENDSDFFFLKKYISFFLQIGMIQRFCIFVIMFSIDKRSFINEYNCNCFDFFNGIFKAFLNHV